MTHSNTQKQASAVHRKIDKNTQFDVFAHVVNTRTHLNLLVHTNAFAHTHVHTRTCTHKTAHEGKEWCRGDSERICRHLSHTSSTGKFSHMAKHKGPMSGNANSPLKPKPIRSLMQTCRAPLSFISPFNVRGLESDSITHPKEKKEKGKRENYRGFQIIHMFSSRAN